jgi:hypothetical protein
MSMQFGEKDHIEHAWSTDIQERIVQLYFQLVRIDIDTQWENIRVPLESLLRTLSESQKDDVTSDGSVDRRLSYPMYISVLFRMLLHTRDIVSGKGEYALAYRMILSWYTYFPALAVHALKTFVISDDDESQPFGSWKDMKCMADVCKQQTGNAHHELILMCIQWINAQLRIDSEASASADSSDSKDSPISLCAKWVPREGSRYAWLFKALAEDYYSETFRTDTEFPYDSLRETCQSLHSVPTFPWSAKKKAYTHYRKLLSGLNRRLDTVQIKQCGNVWADIDHHKTTSITLSRNSKAFLNLTKKKEERSDRPDRIECARKFKEYVDSRVQRGLDVKGGRMGMNDFTKRAMALTKHIYDEDTISTKKNQTVMDLLNAQWRSNAASQQMGNMVNMVAMVDTSSSMTGDPLHAAIALGIRVAEHSVVGKRVLTFSTTPTWHNLEGKDDFVSMVDSLQGAAWGGSTNFYAALKLILDALVDQHIPPADVEGLVLAIFSDMQIDLADSSYARAGMHDTIRQMYQDAGYTCPHILFWNLRSTSGFPCMSSTPNTSMMSGFSPALLNVFCEKGPEALKTATPWNMMLATLNAPRYTTRVHNMKGGYPK